MVHHRGYKVKVLIGEEKYEIIADGKLSLLQNLIKNGIPIDNLCGGKGICGKCAVRIVEGSVSPPTEVERRWMNVLGSDMRLSCQVRILSDAVVELKRIARVVEGKILTWGVRGEIRLRPLVSFQRIRVEPPTLKDQRGDLERILEASGGEHYDPLILEEISYLLRESNFEVNVVKYDNEVVDLIPANRNFRILGAAVDVGTTTVVVYLYDLLTGEYLGVESAYNEQLRFGEDVISRVEYARRGRNNIKDLRKAVVNTINRLIENISQKIGMDSAYIYDMVCAGNTTMLAFLLGNDCYYGSVAPYPPPFTLSVRIKARDLGVKINPKGYVRTVPSISMYVGSDIVADIIASRLHECEGDVALIDLGTNGEIVIKTSEGLFLATSCAAGPALEGYGVRDGMRAVKGAIESVVIDETGRSYYKVIGNTRPEGICGSGIIEAIAWMRIRGIIDEAGRIRKGVSEFVKEDDEGLKFVIVPANASATARDIVLTQKDIRMIQLAKAAIYAALSVLTRIAGLELRDLERVFIAGAFGNYLDIFSAQILGMLPDVPQERFSFIGNGAIAGASMMLLSKDFAKEAQAIAKMVKSVELNLIKDFQSEFVKATYIPHTEKERFEDILNKIKQLIGSV
jgi:uncharacterized 2Fe-2S/4Fe-4S cluster protein (DUF4445 family)